MNYKTYITFASWEERFLLSFKKDIEDNEFERIIMFNFSNGHHLNIQNEIINEVKKIDKKIEIINLLFNDDIANWKLLKHEVFNKPFNNVLLNISTMPRNIIYYLLHFLKEFNLNYNSIYYKSLTHSSTLTKNPLNPSLILQHSGIFDLEKPTLLIVCVGYDEKRVFQLYNYFEPKDTILLTEEKHQTEVNLNPKFDFCLISEKKEYLINSFDKKSIYNKLKQIYEAKNSEYNILICSLGPKISTIDFFEFQVNHPNCGLVYIASKDYSLDYSNGVDLETPILNTDFKAN
jgi:hypothetical protein